MIDVRAFVVYNSKCIKIKIKIKELIVFIMNDQSMNHNNHILLLLYILFLITEILFNHLRRNGMIKFPIIFESFLGHFPKFPAQFK